MAGSLAKPRSDGEAAIDFRVSVGLGYGIPPKI